MRLNNMVDYIVLVRYSSPQNVLVRQRIGIVTLKNENLITEEAEWGY